MLNPLLGSLVESRQENTLTLPVQGLEYAGQDFIDTFAAYDIQLEPYEGDLEATIASAEEAAGLIFTPVLAKT